MGSGHDEPGTAQRREDRMGDAWVHPSGMHDLVRGPFVSPRSGFGRRGHVGAGWCGSGF